MEKNKNVILWGNVILGVLLVAATIIFMQTSVTPYVTKTIASALFVLTGLFNLIMLYRTNEGNKNWKALIIFLGLVFAMLGDIVLIANFVVGAALFAIGHIFFLIYFCLLYKFRWYDFVIIAGILIAAYLLILLYNGFDLGDMRIVVLAYATIISIMLGKAIGNLITNANLPNIITALGAFMFFFSDLMLLFFRFAGRILIFDYLCVYTYYPAEFLLAITILLQYKTYKDRV